MTSREYNALVSRAAENQPLRGTRRDGTGPGPHHWRVTAQRLDASHRVFIGPGTVNDRVAAISYRIDGDPRGWQMPDGYPVPTGETTVDRLLTERIDPPHLLLTSPDGKDGGDFEQVTDGIRSRHPSFFRTAAMWDLELWTAVVFVTAEPLTSSIAFSILGFPLPKRNGRFRVATRTRMPAQPVGTQSGGAHQLATLYLTRVPGKPELDKLYIQQRTFWSLWTANADINPLGPFYDPSLGSSVNFGGIGGGIADAFAQATLATIDAVTSNALAGIAELYSEASTVQFWTA